MDLSGIEAIKEFAAETVAFTLDELSEAVGLPKDKALKMLDILIERGEIRKIVTNRTIYTEAFT